MIQKDSIFDIDINTEDGQILMAALGVLHSIEHKHIDSGKFGPKSDVNDIVKYLVDLANRTNNTDEYKAYSRELKINSIIETSK